MVRVANVALLDSSVGTLLGSPLEGSTYFTAETESNYLTSDFSSYRTEKSIFLEAAANVAGHPGPSEGDTSDVSHKGGVRNIGGRRIGYAMASPNRRSNWLSPATEPSQALLRHGLTIRT